MDDSPKDPKIAGLPKRFKNKATADFREYGLYSSYTPSQMGLMKLVFVFTFLIFIQNIDASPLFEDSFDQPLVVEIKTDLYKIKNKRHEYDDSTENYINGRFQFRDRAFDIKLQTRGYSRLADCPFPPLMIYFDKSRVKNSLLKYNHKLKMVTHCQEDKLHLLFREHLVYKIYNLITLYSFQVRLLEVKYIDIDRKEDPIETYALFIESSRSIKKRLKLEKLTSDEDFNLKTHRNISENWLNTSQLKLQEAFQHLIRNNDWVIFHSEPARTLSLANIKFFYNEKEGFPFPYDFDLAGVVKWDDEGYKNRYDIENLCKKFEIRKAFMKILSHKNEYFQLLDRDPFLSLRYKNKFAEYLNQFKSVDDFCVKTNFDSKFFSRAATSP